MNKYSICTECGSKMYYSTNLEYIFHDIVIKPVKGYKCEKCGEVEFEYDEARKIEMFVQKVRNNNGTNN